MSRGKRKRLAEQAAAAPQEAEPAARTASPPLEQQDARRWSAALAALAAVPYLNTLSNQFVLDDLPIVVNNPLVTSLGNIGRIFASPYWGEKGLYRPLTVTTYAVNHALTGLSPAGFHLTNVALHVTVTLLLFHLARKLFDDLLPAFSAAALFAVHPVHTEDVTSVIGRAEVLAALFVLAGLLLAGAALRAPRSPALIALPAGAYLLGLLSKESAVTLPAVAALWEWLRDEREDEPRPERRTWLLVYGGLAAALGVYALLRSQVVTTSVKWYGFAGVGALDRVLTASRVLMEYLGLLVFPASLSADYARSSVPIARSLAEPAVLLSFALWAGLAVLAVWAFRRSRPLLLGLAWFFVTIAPVSNVAFPIGIGKAERLLYLPSVGFCLAAGAVVALAATTPARRTAALSVVTVAVLLLSARTFVRNGDWKDGVTLAEATLKTDPDSVLFSQIAGIAEGKKGNHARSAELLAVTVREWPEDASFRYNYGNALLSLKRYDDAIAQYREALRLRAGYTDALNNLGRAQTEAGRPAEAVETFKTLLATDRNIRSGYVNLSVAYNALGRLDEAARVLREGLVLFPADRDLSRNLAIVTGAQKSLRGILAPLPTPTPKSGG